MWTRAHHGVVAEISSAFDTHLQRAPRCFRPRRQRAQAFAQIDEHYMPDTPSPPIRSVFHLLECHTSHFSLNHAPIARPLAMPAPTSLAPTIVHNLQAGSTGTAAGGGGGGVLVLMATLPIVHLLSLAALDALSRLPFLKVRPLQTFTGWLGQESRVSEARHHSRICETPHPNSGRFSTFLVACRLMSVCRVHSFASAIPSRNRGTSYPASRLTYLPACLSAHPPKVNERDRIAVMFCGTHKTLAFGIPLIKVLLTSGQWVDVVLSKSTVQNISKR